jgi:PPM family protein phosphatase
MLDVEFAQLSDPGRTRDHNEDFVGHVAPLTPAQARTHGWLFVLADGVGGHERGEVASRTAVENVVSGFRLAASGDAHSSLLPRLVQAANASVFEMGITSGSNGRAMATTLVACALRYDRAVVAHVGDSRCYLIRGRNATQLTRDHTLVNEQVRLGVLSAQDAAESTNKHLLSRSLGGDLFVGVDCSDHQVHAGDILMLCSDGMHGAIKTAELGELVNHSADLEIAAQKLVAIANERDGSDNISVQLIRIRGVERVGMYRGRPYKLR